MPGGWARAGGSRPSGRCGLVRRAGAGEGRAEHWLGGPGPPGDEQASLRGVGGRAWRSLGRRDWAGAAVSQWRAPPTPRRALQLSASGPSAGFAPEAPDLGLCNQLRRRGPGEPCGVVEGLPAFPG